MMTSVNRPVQVFCGPRMSAACHSIGRLNMSDEVGDEGRHRLRSPPRSEIRAEDRGVVVSGDTRPAVEFQFLRQPAHG